MDMSRCVSERGLKMSFRRTMLLHGVIHCPHYAARQNEPSNRPNNNITLSALVKQNLAYLQQASTQQVLLYQLLFITCI